MDKINVAGLKIDSLNKQDLLHLILQRINDGKKIWAVTVYSEFLYTALKNPQVMGLLNSADIAVPDGIGIFWAKRYLDLRLTAKNYWLKIIQAIWQAKYSLAAILFYPGWIKRAFPEKIVGADLVWDITKLAADNNLSIYLLGGHGNTPKIVSEKLTTSLLCDCTKVRVSGYSNKNPDDISIINDINPASPDILLVSYGPIKQEQWIYDNLQKLPSVKFVMGVGGSFDYIAGKRLSPPKWMRRIGLEWFFRLITQPHRIFRIINATFGLVDKLIHFKVFSTFPSRPNVVSIILNTNNRVLICERDPRNHHIDIIHTPESLGSKNYWQFPQGGIDEREDLIQAAKREALEETGLNNLKLVLVSKRTNAYPWNNALRKFWKNRRFQNHGQIQSIVYFRYSGEDNDAKMDYDEFINYKWADIFELKNVIHPERLALAKIVSQDLKEMSEKGII